MRMVSIAGLSKAKICKCEIYQAFAHQTVESNSRSDEKLSERQEFTFYLNLPKKEVPINQKKDGAQFSDNSIDARFLMSKNFDREADLIPAQGMNNVSAEVKNNLEDAFIESFDEIDYLKLRLVAIFRDNTSETNPSRAFSSHEPFQDALEGRITSIQDVNVNQTASHFLSRGFQSISCAHWSESINQEGDINQDLFDKSLTESPKFQLLEFFKIEFLKVLKVDKEKYFGMNNHYELQLTELHPENIEAHVDPSVEDIDSIAVNRRPSKALESFLQANFKVKRIQSIASFEGMSVRPESSVEFPPDINSMHDECVSTMNIVDRIASNFFSQEPRLQRLDRFYISPTNINSAESDLQRSIITLEEGQEGVEVKFISSSSELNDGLVRNQHELRTSFRLLGLDGYEFSFSNEDTTQHQALSKRDVDHGATDTPSVEVLELYDDSSPLLGIDKRI